MKRKLGATLIAAIIFISMLSGCSSNTKPADPTTKPETESGKSDTSSSTKPGEKIQLEFFNQKVEGQEAYEKIIAKFQEENPNIVINIVSPSDAETVFFTRVSTNDIPDIMSIYPAEAVYQNIMSEGIVQDMTGQAFLNNAEESALKLSQFDGKNYAMPYAVSSYGLLVNKTMFEERNLSLPATYEELIEVCKAFEADGIEAIIFADKDPGTLGQEAERMIGIIKNDVFKDFEEVGNGQANFSREDKDYINCLGETMLELRTYAPNNTLSVGREQAVADFINGKYPMYMTGTWSVAAIQKSAPDMNAGMIPMPNPYKGEKTNIPINIDIALGYSSTTAHPEEALKFIEFCSRTEINQILADIEGTPTVIKGVNYNVKALQSIREEITKEGASFLTMVNFWPPGLRNEWSIYLQQMLSDQDVEKLEKETNRICQQYYNQ